MANPMTTAGDLIRGGTAGAPTRVAVGTTGQVLTVAAGVPVWATPAGGGLDLAWQALPDTGWTATAQGGGGTAGSITGGVATLSNPASNSGEGVRLIRGTPYVPQAPLFEMRARCIETANPGVATRCGISLMSGTMGSEVGYRWELTNAGGLVAEVSASPGAWIGISSGSAGLSTTDGTTWLSLLVTPTGVAFRYGTGVGTAPPADNAWITPFTVAANVSLFLGGSLTSLCVEARRTAGGGGAYTQTFDGLAVRSLLGPAP
jgi:hypothetical protein